MKKFLLILMGFFLGFIIFMPKEHLFYKLLYILHNKNIDIQTQITKTPFKMKLENTQIYYLKIKTAQVKNVLIKPFIAFNEIEANDIKLNVGNFIIKNLKIVYIPFLKAKIQGKGNFGEFSGYANLKEIKIYVKHPSRRILAFLKKDKKGYFYYAKL